VGCGIEDPPGHCDALGRNRTGPKRPALCSPPGRRERPAQTVVAPRQRFSEAAGVKVDKVVEGDAVSGVGPRDSSGSGCVASTTRRGTSPLGTFGLPDRPGPAVRGPGRGRRGRPCFDGSATLDRLAATVLSISSGAEYCRSPDLVWISGRPLALDGVRSTGRGCCQKGRCPAGGRRRSRWSGDPPQGRRCSAA